MRTAFAILGYGLFAAVTLTGALVAYSDWQRHAQSSVFAESRAEPGDASR